MTQKWSVTRNQRERERELLHQWVEQAERQNPYSDYWRGQAYAACIALKDELGKAAVDAFIDTFPEAFAWRWAFEKLSGKLVEVAGGDHG